MDGFHQQSIPRSGFESTVEGTATMSQGRGQDDNLVIHPPDDIPGESEEETQLYKLLVTGQQVPHGHVIDHRPQYDPTMSHDNNIVSQNAIEHRPPSYPTTSHAENIEIPQDVVANKLPSDPTSAHDEHIELPQEDMFANNPPGDPISSRDKNIETPQDMVGGNIPTGHKNLISNPTTDAGGTEIPTGDMIGARELLTRNDIQLPQEGEIGSTHTSDPDSDDRMILPQDKMNQMMEILKEHQGNLEENTSNANQLSTNEESTNQSLSNEDNTSNMNQLSINKDNISNTRQLIINQPIVSASSSVQDASVEDWCSFKCKFCPKRFQDRKTWKYHNMDEHGLLPYGCRYCDERYEHKHDLKDHERFHKSNRSKYKNMMAQEKTGEMFIETVAPVIRETVAPGIEENVASRITEAAASDITEAEASGMTEAVSPADIKTEDDADPTIDNAASDHEELESHDQLTTSESVADKKQIKTSPGKGKKKPRHKTKSDLVKTLKHTRKKQNVVVVSVLDVMESDAKLAKQGLKPSGGASGALLDIVDKIKSEHPEHFETLKGNYHLRATKKKGLFDEDDELSHEEDDSPVYTPSPSRRKMKSKSFRRASTKGRKSYACRVCPRMLSSNKVKVYHERGHPYPNECKFCHRALQNKRDLEDHESGHITGSWVCRLCGDSYEDNIAYEIHMKIHLNNDKDNQAFPCQYCNKAMKSKKSLEVHMRVHTGEKPYQCSFCEKSYRHYESWNYHENKHKGTLKQHVCQFCGKAFGGKYGLQVHERIHTGEKPFKCDHCHLAFSSNEKLKVHKDRVNGLAFVCQFCGKNFFTKANLNQHEMIHKGVKPHKCKSCDACFTSVTSLKYHNRTVHTGERYPCQFCNKPCKSKGQLTSHLRSHTDERPFKCKFCNKSFRNSNTLKTHEQGIHLGFRYTCPVCKKDFSQRTALRTHDKLVHQGIKWKDMVLQRKINREQRNMVDHGKLEQSAVDVKFSPGVAPNPKARQPPAPITHHDLSKVSRGREIDEMDTTEEPQASEAVKAHMQTLKLYQQHRMVIPPPAPAPPPPPPPMQEEEPGPSSTPDPSNMVQRLSAKQVQHSFGGLQAPLPVSLSQCDQSSVDVAYQLATLATSARHLLHVRHGQGHHHGDEPLQVHVPSHVPGHHGVHVPHGMHQGDPGGVVDVVFPPDNGPPMYQTL